MITDGRAESSNTAGFPVGCPSRGEAGPVVTLAALDGGCGHPAHGLPTSGLSTAAAPGLTPAGDDAFGASHESSHDQPLTFATGRTGNMT